MLLLKCFVNAYEEIFRNLSKDYIVCYMYVHAFRMLYPYPYRNFVYISS